jgi:hypothetical protein
MKQYSERHVVMITTKQADSLKILKSYDVNIGNFVRQAIKEKLHRDWPMIKEKKSRIKCPF